MNSVAPSGAAGVRLCFGCASCWPHSRCAARSRKKPGSAVFAGKADRCPPRPTGPRWSLLYCLRFDPYDAGTGGTLLWSEVREAVVVIQGAFNVGLGGVEPLPADQRTKALFVQVQHEPHRTKIHDPAETHEHTEQNTVPVLSTA